MFTWLRRTLFKIEDTLLPLSKFPVLAKKRSQAICSLLFRSLRARGRWKGCQARRRNPRREAPFPRTFNFHAATNRDAIKGRVLSAEVDLCCKDVAVSFALSRKIATPQGQSNIWTVRPWDEPWIIVLRIAWLVSSYVQWFTSCHQLSWETKGLVRSGFLDFWS